MNNINDDCVIPTEESITKEQNKVEINTEDFSFQRLQNFSLENSLLQSNKETGNDLARDIHSLTKTLSPTKGAKSDTRNNMNTIHDKELKMSDLVTPSHGVYSLEQELDIQRNKVRQLKEELNATVKAHLQQMESLKISHEEEMVMMKRQMKIEQVCNLLHVYFITAGFLLFRYYSMIHNQRIDIFT
ncbi:hypothetical protein WDU94_004680 [Cyamophila willieti]